MKKNKVILINTGSEFRDANQDSLNMPLGIIYLGTYLNKHGIDVTLLDTRLMPEDDFLRLIPEKLEEAFLVGLSVMTNCVGIALRITKQVKDYDPAIVTVWGGMHPTLFDESTIRNSFVDFVIVKEGEKGLLGLVEFLSGRREIKDIPNLVFKHEGEISRNQIESGVELEGLDIPKYELLPSEVFINRQISPGYSRRQAEVLTSRGCPHRCSFCVNVIVNKCLCRSEPVWKTLENVDYLIKRFKVEHIFFMDEDFFYNRNRIQALIPEIAKRGITWESNCRADYVSSDYLNDDFLQRLYASGCIMLRLGLESGSQRILNLLKKDITLGDSLRAVKKITQHKITSSTSFMMGIPGETRWDIMKTLELILKLYKIKPEVDIMMLNVFRPYPGSELFDKCVENGLAVPEELDEWSDFFMHDNLAEYKLGLPWFSDQRLFRRVNLCMEYLKKAQKCPALRIIICPIVRFHIFTGCKFIDMDYFLYTFMKKVFSNTLKPYRKQSFKDST